MPIMNEEAKNALKATPRGKCYKCAQPRNYITPLARCHSCRKRFCFDDINSGQICASMKENDEVRDICDNCKKEKGYL